LIYHLFIYHLLITYLFIYYLRVLEKDYLKLRSMH